MFYAPIDSTDAGDRVTRELRVGAVPGFMGAFVLLDGWMGSAREGGGRVREKNCFKKTALDSLLSFPSSIFIFPGLIQSLITYFYNTLHIRAIRLSGGEGGKICFAIWHMLKILSVQL